MNDEVEKILKEYRRIKPLYIEFTDFVVDKLDSILKDLPVFKYRIVKSQKTEESLKEKIERKGIKKIEEIKELSRAKIILYFEEDIDVVKSEIYKNFNVLEEKFNPFFKDIDGKGNNIFKLIVNLKEKDVKKEIIKFRNLKFDIHITTELYNVISELEHVITYKPVENIKEKYEKEWKVLKKEFIDIMESYIEPSQIKFNQIIKKFKGLLKK